MSVLSETTAAVRRGGADARAAWRPEQSAAVVLVAFAAALPWIGPGWIRPDVLASWLYLGLAATGLVLTVGFGGVPSLGQGAFMSIGAFTTALLTARAGWPVVATIPVAVAVALGAGLLTGLVIVRQPPLFVAVSTWIFAWLVLLAAVEFPGVSGGSQGYVVPSGLSTTGHYELALGLTALAAAGVSALRRGSTGLRLRAVRDRPAAAAALGVRNRQVMLGAFAASAAVGGLAGSLAVQLAGVSDPSAFDPFTSFELLAAILLGGASYACAGIVGVGILGVIALVAHAWASIQGNAPAQLQPMLASLLLLAVFGLGGEGLIPALVRLRPRGARADAGTAAPTEPSRPAGLSARGLRKDFGGVRALAGLDLDVGPGETVAIVGANGSGKTTALRALAGVVELDAGEVDVDGRAVGGESQEELARLGVVRTLQRTGVFGSMTALENVLVGAGLRLRTSGPVRALAATPKARTEARAARAAALGALGAVGLEGHAGTRADRLDGFQQRLLMLAAALATRPRLLLLDEPAAGAARAEKDRLAAILRGEPVGGLSVVLVEHDLELVRAVADRVVVMADGHGAPGGS